MREITPVKTPGESGIYSNYDLEAHMAIYADISPWRTARVMRIAERELINGRQVLVVTENNAVMHLANQGFLLYRPATDGFDVETDFVRIMKDLLKGRGIVINTNCLSDENKKAISRKLVAELSLIELDQISLIIESTEQFFPRRWNFGKQSGVGILNNLLKRFKSSGGHFVSAAESSEDIAVEIGRSCGVAVVGRITNHERVKTIASAIDSRLLKHADEIYGLKMLNPDDYFIFNPTTATRRNAAFDPSNNTQPVEAIGNLVANENSMLQAIVVPRWLVDEKLDCGYDPNNPTKPSSTDSPEQVSFVNKLKSARAKAAAKRAVKADQKTQKVTVKKALNSPAVSSTRFDGAQIAIGMVRSAGVANAERMVSIGLKIINSRDGILNAPVNNKLNSRAVARRIIEDDLLRQAVNAGFALYHRNRLDVRTVISTAAFATAFYQALNEDEKMAHDFFDDIYKAPRGIDRTERGLMLEKQLKQLGVEQDVKRRSEAQYSFLKNAWCLYKEESQQAQQAA